MQIGIVRGKNRTIVAAPAISTPQTGVDGVETVVGFLQISVYRNLSDIERIWRAFENDGVCSLYQRFDWAAKWMETSGNAQGASPYIVLGQVDGQPQFLFPFAVFCRGPFCIVNWIGGSHSNFNMGIFDANFLKNVRMNDMRAIFKKIVAGAKDIDAFELCCQPMSWQGHNNPLNFLKRLESPNHAFSMQLAPNFDDVLAAHNGKKKRKKYRSQMRALEHLGGPVLIRAESPQDIARLLDISLQQLELRLSRIGVANMFGEEGTRDFFYDLAVSSIGSAEPSLLIYGLEVDCEIRATFAGGGHQGRFSGCFTSIAMDDLSHISPGDLLLYLVIEDCAKRGYSSFDLGRGEERYKSSWCNEVVPMFESIIPVSRKATILTIYDRLSVTVKRIIKQNPKLWRFTKRVRAKLKW